MFKYVFPTEQFYRLGVLKHIHRMDSSVPPKYVPTASVFSEKIIHQSLQCLLVKNFFVASAIFVFVATQAVIL